MTEEQNQVRVIPPYVSFVTFSSALASLAEHGVPAQIDRSVFPSFAGSAQRQVLQAFKFMGLIDEFEHSTELLKEFAKSDRPHQKEILATILQKQFPEQVQILKDGTLNRLKASFDSTGMESSVKAKCIAFLLKAAKEAGLEISSHITRGQRLRPSVNRSSLKKESQRKQKEPVLEDDEIDQEESNEKHGKLSIPIPLRPGKVWKVFLDEGYSTSDVRRFMKILEMVLLEEAEDEDPTDGD